VGASYGCIDGEVQARRGIRRLRKAIGDVKAVSLLITKLGKGKFG
jgi:hypothetical protein